RKAAAKTPVQKAQASLRQSWDDAMDQIGKMTDSAKLKAKQLAAKEKVLERRAELAAKAELDKAKHLADQAEKWMKARARADQKKVAALEKKLMKQLRDAERKLVAQAKAAEKKAEKKARAVKKKLEAKARQITRKPAARRKAAAPKKTPAKTKAKTKATSRKKS
ncbi:MAG: hypothetical protein KDI04_14610, partial [Halieaceae bacterium]|nr:hypothetical protein [Halieaceae bacterium]